MFLFALMPPPLAIFLMIPVICGGMYYFFFIKFNEYESDKLRRIEKRTVKSANIVLVFITIMVVFRDNSNAELWAGFIGANISLCLIYIIIIAAYLIMRDQKIKSNGDNLVDVYLNNHKRGLYCLIAGTLMLRFSIIGYIAKSSISILEIIGAFILLWFTQKDLSKNLNVAAADQNEKSGNIFKSYSTIRNAALAIIMAISIVFL